ncbi:putative bifunctional diguanylate cyclase/phosphodiesterase [Pelagibacterium montanilacus]|uniref:putative bifunctional diguanylate cyclase/phosphodiesterase n=1 Tax=Pelagibacterium montanilacus TaxID=2185280 RepID=UPI000F8ECA96|nr:GGDEF domain-containing phosphodiesterase [Pelagibacterium montanilacus]
MNSLSIYTAVARFGKLNYRAKIMIMAFLGTHIPLLGIIAWSVFNLTADPALIWGTLLVALVATLAGTGVTLFILNALLQPVLITSKALRTYSTSRQILDLPRGFTDEAGTLMADAAETLTRLETTLVELETLDKVTGLANRASLATEIDARMARGEPVSLVVFRLAMLERITASFDQGRADLVMRVLASRLGGLAPAGAPIGRIDDQSLAMVLSDPDAAGVSHLAKTVLSGLGARVVDGAFESAPTFSVGIATSTEDAERAEVLVDRAIAAAVDTSAVNGVSIFTAQSRERMRERYVLEQELRSALVGNQFSLHYQPVVDLGRGKVTGAEALLRWTHPEMGMIPPAKFIPIAERTGLIDEIGLWVLREACGQVGRWKDEGNDPLRIAVNLSASQFLDPRIETIVREAMDAARIEPGLIEIELTETAAMADADYTRRTFSRLKDMGISVAIDDFGTGYASMSYLRKLPFDKLKIDREFVTHVDTDTDSQAICEAVIALSKGLGLKILAEGTERREEVDFLTSRGCSLFQGYYFSKPVPASALMESIADIAMRNEADAADRATGSFAQAL